MQIENGLSIILMALGLYEAVTGILSMTTGRIFQDRQVLEEEYTPESVAAYARPYGLATLLLGLSIALVNSVYVLNLLGVIPFPEGGSMQVILLIATVLCLAGGMVLIVRARNKYLVKK